MKPRTFFAVAEDREEIRSADEAASKKEQPESKAYVLIFVIVVAPIPRLGTLMIRVEATSSTALSIVFRYARTSLISRLE